jgi:hypothetical protein
VSGAQWPWRAFGIICAMLCGCSFDKTEHVGACRKDGDCAGSQRCFQGFCIQKNGKADAGGRGSDGGHALADAGDSGPGQTGERCLDGQPPESCYEGPAGTVDVGICKAGQRACVGGVFTQCLGQVVPGQEACNGKDDDCNGQTDEIAMGDCQTQMPGACNAGQLVCRGTFAVCELTSPPKEETCNGKDDDCDGKTDEVASGACYPAGKSGCTIAADGTAMCVGLCRAGTSACSGGQDLCTDAVTPVAEACTTGSSTAADENCDGQVDEGCACTTGQERPCYAGPTGTSGKGACRPGTQRCVASLWGDCEGQVLPQPETCDNSGVDDDCNGTQDDVPGLGNACIDDMQLGICRDGTMQCTGGASAPVCVTAKREMELCDAIDQDCDGNPYNGFDLNNDPSNCGKCGNACNKAETCCGGNCIPIADLQTDVMNCGECGKACGGGQYCCQGQCLNGLVGHGGLGSLCQCTQDCGDRSCCGTQCVDLTSDSSNCGACGNDCTSGGTTLKSCCRGVCSTLCAVGLGP